MRLESQTVRLPGRHRLDACDRLPADKTTCAVQLSRGHKAMRLRLEVGGFGQEQGAVRHGLSVLFAGIHTR